MRAEVGDRVKLNDALGECFRGKVGTVMARSLYIMRWPVRVQLDGKSYPVYVADDEVTVIGEVANAKTA